MNFVQFVGEEVLLKEFGERMRNVREGPDGALWLLTDNPKGMVLRMVPSPTSECPSERDFYIPQRSGC